MRIDLELIGLDFQQPPNGTCAAEAEAYPLTK